MKQQKSEQIKEVLTRSVSAIFPSSEAFEKALLSSKKMSIYIGIDPTGPHLHLGHLTNLLWMKKMQSLGHRIIFLIGDFTAMIGDPTDKMSERQPLTRDQVKKNMQTFKEQASRIILFSGKNPATIRYNSEWYKKTNVGEFMEGAIGYFTLQNMLQRDMFKERLRQGKQDRKSVV